MTRWFFRVHNSPYASGVPDRGRAGIEVFVSDWEVPKCPVRKVIYHLAGKPLTQNPVLAVDLNRNAAAVVAQTGIHPRGDGRVLGWDGSPGFFRPSMLRFVNLGPLC